MGLPRKVQEISDAAEAAAQQAGMKPGSQTSVQDNPVTAAPDKKPEAKVDQDDYKERFFRYKNSTDQTIADLRQTLGQVQNTLADAQRQNQEISSQLNELRNQKPDVLDKSTSNQADAAYKIWLNKLPAHIKEEYQEDYLRDQYDLQMSFNTDKPAPKNDDFDSLKQTVSEVKQYQEKTQAQLYEEAMDKAYPDDKWIKLTQTEDWGEFCAKRLSPVDQRTYGEIVDQGNKTHNANTVIWVLSEYEKHLQTLDSKKENVVDPLAAHLTPETAGNGGDPIKSITEQTETFTLSQVNQFFKDIATTDKYTPEEAKVIEQKIIAAQAAGKILPG